MSTSVTPSKRPFEGAFHESNETGKWPKIPGSHSQSHSSKISSGKVVFRLLCPSAKTGGVIGKGGGIISHIRKETGAKIRVEESVGNCEERVIRITGSQSSGANSGSTKKENGGIGPPEKDTSDPGENDDEKEDKEEPSPLSPPQDHQISSVQKALLLVFERIIADDKVVARGGDVYSSHSARLLIFSGQVASVSSMINKITSSTGAQVLLLSRDMIPECASLSDELVQVTGGEDACKRALQAISLKIIENPASDQESYAHPPRPKPKPKPKPEHHSPPGVFLPPPPPLRPARFGGDFSRAEMMLFKLLCTADKVPLVIGKGGAIVRGIELDTGCEIRVSEGGGPSDRVVAVSGPVRPDERLSRVQEALLRVQERILCGPEKLVSRVLVMSGQIGCLLGKGGAIIADMRRTSGAHIRVLGKGAAAVGENEEVVQITADFEAAHQNALLQVTSRLQRNFFGDDPLPVFDARHSSPPTTPRFTTFSRHAPAPVPLPTPFSWQMPVVAMSNTFEVRVPRHIVPLISGGDDDGGCLNRIREISDARIVMMDVMPGAAEGVIVISGMPDQTHAAQSLIQAFVLSEQHTP